MKLMGSDENLKKKKEICSLLFELPQNFVASFCIEWLNMVDLCHLDSAVCSKKWRTGFLNILKQETAVFNGFIYSETFKKDHLLEHDPSEIFSKGLCDVRASPTIEPYIAPFDNPEYSAFHTGHRQFGEQSLPKTLRSRQKLENKERKKYLLERWQDKSLVRHSYSVPESVFCFPHHDAGLLYIHWLTVRKIHVKHLLVTIDFRSKRGKECFLNYLKGFQDAATTTSSNNSNSSKTSQFIGKKRLRFSDYDDNDDDFQYFTMEDYFSPRKMLTDIFSEINTSDEFEMIESLESGGCSSSSSSFTNVITPIQSHWNASAARMIDLRDNNADMDVTIEYNNAINISAIQCGTSPSGLKGSSGAESFADTVAVTSTGKLRAHNVYRRLRSICFRRCAGVTDDVIIAINPCNQLETLELLDCTMITEDGFVAMIEGWTSLKSLNVRESNRLSDTAIISVAERCPNLTLLDMHSCNRVTDSALSSVASHCKGIRNLFLSFGFSVSDDGLNDIVVSCHDSLESISFELCNKVSDEGMAIFSQITCPAMSQMNLWGCTKLTDACLVPIVKGCPNLTSLSVGLCIKMNDEAVKIAVQGCTLLQHLNLNYCNQVTDEALKHIALYCHTLKSLGLSMCNRVSNMGMTLVLKSCRELENLNLECCNKISDDFLALSVLVKTKRKAVVRFEEPVEGVAVMLEQEEVVQSMDVLSNSSIIHNPTPLSESFLSSSSTLLEVPQDSGLDNDTSMISDESSSTLKDSNNSSMVVSSNDCDIYSSSLQNNQSSTDGLMHSPVGGFFKSSANGQINSCLHTPKILLFKLRQVNLSECKLLTDVSLRLLAKHSPHLRILNVLQCPNLTREGMNILKQSCCDIQITHTIS